MRRLAAGERGRRLGSLTAAALALAAVACSDVEPTVDESEDAGARAHLEELSRTFYLAERAIPRHPRAAPIVLSPGSAWRFERRAERLVPYFADELRAVVTLPRSAQSEVELHDPASGVAVRFALEQALDSEASLGDGLVLYRDALGAGADVVHRPTADGTEDFIVLPQAPAEPAIHYQVEVSAVPGLRLVGNTLEFLDDSGTPRLRMGGTALVTASHRAVAARIELEGCEASRDGRAPWNQPVQPPGAASCRVTVAWDADAVDYPALLDPTWSWTGNMVQLRSLHTATFLNNGKVLVAGGDGSSIVHNSAELFDPATNTWAATGSMNGARTDHRATLLADGRVLVTGGFNVTPVANPRAEIYDPTSASQMWTATPMPMLALRYDHAAELLNNGKVLVFGGDNGTTSIDDAELYDPVAGTFVATGTKMTEPRASLGSSLLDDGSVLATGGSIGSTDSQTAERYVPSNDAWVATSGDMTITRCCHTSQKLNDGTVLLAGGWTEATGEIYDPALDGFTETLGGLAKFHADAAAALLVDGSVLVVAGWDYFEDTTFVEIYDRASDSFWVTAPIAVRRYDHTATALPNGKILAAGGRYNELRAEVYEPDVPGTACNIDGQCQGGHCVDGVCCASACDSVCEACSTTGVCEPIPMGMDPDNDCPAESPASCGSIGSCNGAGVCILYGAGTLCGEPSCSDASAVSLACDGTGTCVQGIVSCDPYACAGSGCATSCNGDGSCAPSGWCQLSDATCQPDREDGAVCDRDVQCLSAKCLHGRCATIGGCVDDHTYVDPNGEFVSCAPFACGPQGCYPSCHSVLECASPNVCDGDGACVPALHRDSDEGCAVADHGDRWSWLWSALVLFALRRRSR